MTMPNLFLVAAPRTGSTQLAHWLASHPDVNLSLVKEPNFFAAHEFDPDYVTASHLNDIDPTRRVSRPTQFAVFRDPDRYAALFDDMTTPWRMDASTSYLSCPEAPARIHTSCPGAKVILLTRDPFTRAISHYKLAQRTGRTRARLGDEIAAELTGQLPLAARYLLRHSQQESGVARFRAAFGDQSHHLTFEDMVDSPRLALDQIARFLSIDRHGFDLTAKARNSGAEPRFARLNAALLRCGLKTQIRRALPLWAKPHLRRLWFDETRNAFIHPNDIAALRTALESPCES